MADFAYLIGQLLAPIFIALIFWSIVGKKESRPFYKSSYFWTPLIIIVVILIYGHFSAK